MSSLALIGLVQAAQKRRFLGRAPALRLAEYAASRGIADAPGLRAWLASGEGLAPDLGKKLLSLLPKPDMGCFGPYVPLAHLPDGGMGSVWLAHRTGSEDLVVVKTMKASAVESLDASKGTELLRRFERETSITRQLHHPNVVCCIDAGVADAQTTFMVLEYVDSGDLRDLVEAKGGLSEGLALAIVCQVLDGLAEAHRLKLIHRDIKPPNIFVSSDGRAKLADFGIARSTESHRTMLTMEGAIVGSPQYMSPEQILSDPTLDIRSDVYAMGCVLYFCLAGQPPYQGKLQEILHQHCTAPIPDVRQRRASVSDAVIALLNKAMAKDRGLRFQSPTDMRAAVLATMQAIGLHPGAAKEESTAVRDWSGLPGSGVHRDIATLTADLRRQAGLDDMSTLADAHVATEIATATLAHDAPQAPTASTGADMPTLAADWSEHVESVTVGTGPAAARADLPTMAMSLASPSDPAAITVGPASAPSPAPLDDFATMTAQLLAAEGSTVATPQPNHDPGTSATVHEELGTIARILAGKEPTSAPLGEPFRGDPTTALEADWINLVPRDPADPSTVVLYARTRILLGKLKDAPVDVCLRNYPVAVHKEACQRISRSHVVLRYDPVQHVGMVEDQQAANGTLVDGIALAPGGHAVLAPQVDNILDVAGVVTLWARCLPRQGGKVRALAGLTGAPGVCGLDTDHGCDAITLTRPANRSEMAYALVLRRLSVGGPGADLPLAGARTRAAVEFARFANRWIWRPAAAPGQAPAAWMPLADGTALDCGGRILTARAGDLSVF